MPSNFDRYQRIAPLYDLQDLPFERWRYRTLRPRLFVGLSGRILDAGVGTGRNFPFYPPGAEAIGIDISPAMLARAERRRSQSLAAIELGEMDVTHLRLPHNSFDAASPAFFFASSLTSSRASSAGARARGEGGRAHPAPRVCAPAAAPSTLHY